MNDKHWDVEVYDNQTGEVLYFRNHPDPERAESEFEMIGRMFELIDWYVDETEDSSKYLVHKYREELGLVWRELGYSYQEEIYESARWKRIIDTVPRAYWISCPLCGGKCFDQGPGAAKCFSCGNAWTAYQLTRYDEHLHNGPRDAIEAARSHHPDCQCSICVMGEDAWLWNTHPSEY